MRVIDDPLGQTHSPASIHHYSRLNYVLFCELLKSGDGRTDRTTRANIVIPTGRDCGSAQWTTFFRCTSEFVHLAKQCLYYYHNVFVKHSLHCGYSSLADKSNKTCNFTCNRLSVSANPIRQKAVKVLKFESFHTLFFKC